MVAQAQNASIGLINDWHKTPTPPSPPSDAVWRGGTTSNDRPGLKKESLTFLRLLRSFDHGEEEWSSRVGLLEHPIHVRR